MKNLFQLSCFLFSFITLFSTTTFAQVEFNGKTIVDQWRVVDLKTDEDKALMEIYEKDGQYFAKIVQLFGMTEDEAANEVCNKCQDDRKGQKLLGMEIMSGLEKGEDKFEGEIIDLQKGKVYKAVVWLENEDRLKVRTMVPIIFKDEVWFRKS